MKNPLISPECERDRTGIILVCFAVKEEAGPFNELRALRPQIKTLLTGIGPRNAEKAIRSALAAQKPALVLSCGFAGGLHPEIVTGTVLFTAEPGTDLESALLKAGARPARFHCAEKVAATAAQKRALREITGADAVEMESQIICAICREKNIPNAIVRVVLDVAEEDLPLDFNAFMTADQRMDYGKLALALLKAPGKIGPLRRLQKQAQSAAERLAGVLAKVIC